MMGLEGGTRRENGGGGGVPAHPVPSDPGKRLAKGPFPGKKQSGEPHVYLHNICIRFASDLHKSPSLGRSSLAVL